MTIKKKTKKPAAKKKRQTSEYERGIRDAAAACDRYSGYWGGTKSGAAKHLYDRILELLNEKRMQPELYAVVRFLDYEGPDNITLYPSKIDADKACPKNIDYQVVGPLVIGKEASLYG